MNDGTILFLVILLDMKVSQSDKTVFALRRSLTASQDRRREDNIIDGNPGDKVENRKSLSLLLQQGREAIIFLAQDRKDFERVASGVSDVEPRRSLQRAFVTKNLKEENIYGGQISPISDTRMKFQQCPSRHYNVLFLPFRFPLVAAAARLSDCQRA